MGVDDELVVLNLLLASTAFRSRSFLDELIAAIEPYLPDKTPRSVAGIAEAVAMMATKCRLLDEAVEVTARDNLTIGRLTRERDAMVEDQRTAVVLSEMQDNPHGLAPTSARWMEAVVATNNRRGDRIMALEKALDDALSMLSLLVGRDRAAALGSRGPIVSGDAALELAICANCRRPISLSHRRRRGGWNCQPA